MNVVDSNPDGFISLEGDPEMGVDFYVSIQPLPAVLQTGTGHHHMDEIRWPPCAADELEPIPRAIKLAGSTAAGGYKIKTVVDCGACPNDVINQIRANRPPRRDHPNISSGWKWPISGGKAAPLDPNGAQHLLATTHIDGTVGLWACGSPGQNTSLGSGLNCFSSSCECIYEFEPRLLCERGGFKPPKKPAVQTLTLCLQSRLLCLGCSSGDVLVCTVKPGAGGSGGSQNETGSAVYLLHCLQGVHTCAISHLALIAQEGKLAIADIKGNVSVLDLETGHHQLLPIPTPDTIHCVRSLIVGNAPFLSGSGGGGGEEEEEECVPVPVLLVGMVDGTIAVCHVVTGDLLCVLLSPPNSHEEPITFMSIISRVGVQQIDPVTRKFVSKKEQQQQQQQQTTTEGETKTKKEETSSEDMDDMMAAVNAVATEGDSTPPLPSRPSSSSSSSSSSSPSSSSSSPSSSTPSSSSSSYIGERFLVVVAGCDVRLLALKFPAVSDLRAAGPKPLTLQLAKQVKLESSAPTTVATVSVYANFCEQPGEYPALVFYSESFNKLICLSLPHLDQVYEDDIVAFEDVEGPRKLGIMATGDIIIVTKSNTNIHRQTLPVVSLLGYHNRPIAFESAWGNQNILGGGIVKMTANAQKKMKNKKAARASVAGGGGWFSKKKPADLNKIFGKAHQQMEEEQEANLRELGLNEESRGDGETTDARTRAKNGASEVQQQMSENVRKLQERGERINALQDSTCRLANIACTFEAQAKLVRQQEDDSCVVQ